MHPQGNPGFIPAIHVAMSWPFNHPWQAAAKATAPLPKPGAGLANMSSLSSARTGYPFQLPVVHSCQSNKSCVLQGVVLSTALGHITSIITLAASRRDDQKIKPIPLVMATQPKVLGIRNWRRNSLLGEFPSHHLPPGKHLGTDRQGRRSWQPASTEKP